MKSPLHGRKSAHELPESIAQQILANVFTACGREMNSVPLDALTAYSNYRKERYALQRTVIILILILFLLLPLLFIAGRVQLALVNPSDAKNPVYALSVQSSIPVRQIQATLDGRNIPVYEDAPGEYRLSPRENGDMQIRVTLLNRQMTTVDVAVRTADSSAPQLLATEFDERCVYLTVSDESGVDFAAVVITAEDGSYIQPISFEENAGRIAIPYPDCTMTIHIPDLRGNALDVLLRPQS